MCYKSNWWSGTETNGGPGKSWVEVEAALQQTCCLFQEDDGSEGKEGGLIDRIIDEKIRETANATVRLNRKASTPEPNPLIDGELSYLHSVDVMLATKRLYGRRQTG